VVRAAGPWYVSTLGSDSNDCLSSATPCATINTALNQPSFLSGDTILIATGTYASNGSEVVLLNKDATLSGGWNETFTSRNGLSTIDGQGVSRGISVLSGIATIENFIIQNGFLSNTGGGILNFGTLTVNNSTVANNSTDFGGGITNAGTLTLNNSTVSGNSATIFGGGILNSGGTVTVNNSTVSGNSSANSGGGFANSGGLLTLNNTTVSSNSATTFGGGIVNAGGPTSNLILNNSTVSGNSTVDSGGGIANFSDTGTVTLNYSTITNNISDSDSDGSGDGGGYITFNPNGTAILQSSIIAGNQRGLGGVNDFAADCSNSGAMISQGYNLTGSDTGCDPLGGTGDVTVMPANVFTDVLGLLADNGGSTQTHALLDSPSTPALNTIPSGTNSCGSIPFDFDQRGVTRPQGTACDMGAFELEIVSNAIEVTIDVKPGNSHNRIEIKLEDDDEKISVAILSTKQFSASQQVDRASLTFGSTGNENSLNLKGRKHAPDCQVKDVNRDGFSDLVCKFLINKTGFQLGDTIGILNGMTLTGNPITGQDSVKIKKSSQEHNDDHDD